MGKEGRDERVGEIINQLREIPTQKDEKALRAAIESLKELSASQFNELFGDFVQRFRWETLSRGSIRYDTSQSTMATHVGFDRLDSDKCPWLTTFSEARESNERIIGQDA